MHKTVARKTVAKRAPGTMGVGGRARCQPLTVLSGRRAACMRSGMAADPFPRTLMPPVRLPATVDPDALLVVGYLRAAQALLLDMHGTGRMDADLVASTLGALRVAIYAAEAAARHAVLYPDAPEGDGDG